MCPFERMGGGAGAVNARAASAMGAGSKPVERLCFVRVVLSWIAQAVAQPSILVCERPDQALARGDRGRLLGEDRIRERLLRGDDAKAVPLQRVQQVPEEQRVEQVVV